MEIKTQPKNAPVSSSIEKEETKTPKRSFKEIHKKKEEDFPEKEEGSIFDIARDAKDPAFHAPLPAGEMHLEASTTVQEVGKISGELSPLIEEMAHVIVIESHKGISKTTVTLSLDNSLFDGTEVVIEHYDTDPHSFNLQIGGSPEAVEIFQAQLQTLEHSLKHHETLQGFHVRLLNPIIQEKKELYERGRISTNKLQREKAQKIVEHTKETSS